MVHHGKQLKKNRSVAVGNPASYSGGPWFKSRSGDRLFDGFRDFSQYFK